MNGKTSGILRNLVEGGEELLGDGGGGDLEEPLVGAEGLVRTEPVPTGVLRLLLKRIRFSLIVFSRIRFFFLTIYLHICLVK